MPVGISRGMGIYHPRFQRLTDKSGLLFVLYIIPFICNMPENLGGNGEI